MTARPLNQTRNEALAAKGIAVISVPDNRWGRVDIKTVGLLPNVLARQAAIEQGARDAWFVDKDGIVTEAASANAWIVTPAGKLVTRQADHAILRGITRAVAARRHQGARADGRGARLHAGGGLCRARGLRDLGEPDRAAGGAASTADRSATASRARSRPRCGANFIAMRRPGRAARGAACSASYARRKAQSFRAIFELGLASACRAAF